MEERERPRVAGSRWSTLPRPAPPTSWNSRERTRSSRSISRPYRPGHVDANAGRRARVRAAGGLGPTGGFARHATAPGGAGGRGQGHRLAVGSHAHGGWDVAGIGHLVPRAVLRRRPAGLAPGLGPAHAGLTGTGPTRSLGPPPTTGLSVVSGVRVR